MLVRMAGSAITLRLADVVDAEVRQFAADMGVPTTAALSVLVVEALIARGRHGGAGTKDDE